MYKQLIVLFIVIMSPLYSMEKSKPVVSGMMVLTQDIARNQIQSWLTFQEISRLKRLSKYYNQLYDTDLNCSHSRGDVCSTYACNYCAKSYYQCTKMLVHFALRFDEQMFKHVWFHHKDTRKSDVERFIRRKKKKHEVMIKGEKTRHSKPEITIQEEMRYYREHYKHVKNIHSRMFRYVREAIDSQDSKKIDKANTMLSESGLTVFDLLKTDTSYDPDTLFYNACLLHNTNLIKNMCGGCVDDRSFPYVIFYADDQVLCDLIDKDILSAESATKDGKKSVLHYAAERGCDNVIKRALEKGAYVNGRDFYEKTPLHYAVKEEKLGAVIELLQSADADVRLKDKKGKTAIDYNTPKLKHLLHVPKVTDERKAIARLLMEHKDQHQVSGYSYSKVHSNGYQELQI
jgi:hypothetical protein